MPEPGSEEVRAMAVDAARAVAGRAAESAGAARERVERATVPAPVAREREQGWFVVAGLALASFALLFGIVRTNRSAATDVAITLRLQRQKHPLFNRLMQFVSWFGFPPQSRLIPPALAATIVLLGHPLEGLFQLLAWGTGGISYTVKRIMRRQRPSHPEIAVAVARIGGSSFPSGHVINYLGVYGFLAFLIDTWVRPAAVRRLLVAFLTGLIALVGPSRVYLGHHWFTDTLASYLLGTAYLIGLTAVYRRARDRLYPVSETAREQPAGGIDNPEKIR
jgi:undecaprenyl-diphosphatase